MQNKVQQILKLINQLNKNEYKELLMSTPEIVNPITHSSRKLTIIGKQNNLHPVNKVCPHCLSDKYRPYGTYRKRKRFRCRSCLRTFNELTGSPTAGTHLIDKWDHFVNCMVEGMSIRSTAKKIDVCAPTIFQWRHKLLLKYEKIADMKLKGIVEADETFFLFSEKGKRGVSKHRTPRKRGGKAKKAGISNEQIPVIAGCDRNGNVILGVAGRGRITMVDVENILNNFIGDKVTLCTDAHSSFKSYAKTYKLNYVGLNISQGKRVVRKKYHIQNVNSFHSRLKLWMARFKGVSTKYLQNYMNWFSLLEETKIAPEHQVVEFTKRSVPAIM